MEYCNIAEAGFEVMTQLLPHLKCWDYRCAPLAQCHYKYKGCFRASSLATVYSQAQLSKLSSCWSHHYLQKCTHCISWPPPTCELHPVAVGTILSSHLSSLGSFFGGPKFHLTPPTQERGFVAMKHRESSLDCQMGEGWPV